MASPPDSAARAAADAPSLAIVVAAVPDARPPPAPSPGVVNASVRAARACPWIGAASRAGAAAGDETAEIGNGGAGDAGGGAALVSTETSPLRQASPGLKRAKRR